MFFSWKLFTSSCSRDPILLAAFNWMKIYILCTICKVIGTILDNFSECPQNKMILNASLFYVFLLLWSGVLYYEIKKNVYFGRRH